MVCGLKQLAIHTKDVYQIAYHFHMCWAKGPPMSTAQNIMVKLSRCVGAKLEKEVKERKEEEKGEVREEGEEGEERGREGQRRGRGGEKRRWEQ